MDSAYTTSNTLTLLKWPWKRNHPAITPVQQQSKYAISGAVVSLPPEPRPRPSSGRIARPLSLVLPAPLLIPPKSPLPRLPVELWEFVFSLATDEHILKAFFQITSEAPFTAYKVSDFMLDYVYIQAAATMRACTLVNREWSDRAVQYLYRYVWLRSASDAELLARTLAPSFRRSARVVRLQHLVQNLLVRFPKEHAADGPPARTYSKRLVAILRNTPNLAVFLHNDAQDANLPRKAVRALSAIPSLCRAEWTTTAHSAIIAFPASLRHLRSLTLQCPGMPNHVDPTPAVELELPHLHTLSIAFCRQQALAAAAYSKWRMPALRYLSICRCSVLGAAFGPKSQDTVALLTRVGPHLDQLELNCAMGGTTPDLCAMCPRLRTLLISALSLPSVTSHPTLELVGLHQPIGFAPPPAEMDALLALLYCLKRSKFPSLRTVRYLVPAQAVKRLSAHPGSGLRAALQAISAGGVNVEDVGRNVISFARPGVHPPSEDYWDIADT